MPRIFPSIPTLREGLTDEEKTRLRDAKKLRKIAKKGQKKTYYDSEQYWIYAKIDVDQENEINELHWIGWKRAYTDIMDYGYLTSKLKYIKQRKEIGLRRRSIYRRAPRYKALEAVRSRLGTHTEDLASARIPFIELFMTMTEKPYQVDQETFVRDLNRSYGAKTQRVAGEFVWDAVSGRYTGRYMTNPTRIFPFFLGQQMMLYIFGGDAQGEINTARNGLWLPRGFEREFNRHAVVIVPARAVERKRRQWKILVLDESIRDTWAGLDEDPATFGEIHGRRLNFRTDAQPRARYFYFHYLCAMIKLSRQENASLDEVSRAWVSEGSYLRENVMRAFIDYLGHEITPAQSERMLQHSSEGIAPDEMEQCAKALDDMELDSEGEEEEEEMEAEDEWMEYK
ncbi:hypothetical protein FQN54_000260 [Arachnomyces sp. PD_36]|nr:hypothetical protein FQN54_000260 [Arachnomyces sp. PD_36]